MSKQPHAAFVAQTSPSVVHIAAPLALDPSVPPQVPAKPQQLPIPIAPAVIEVAPQSPAHVHFDIAAARGDVEGEMKALDEAFEDFSNIASEIMLHIPDADAMRARLNHYEAEINKKLELTQKEEAFKILAKFGNSLTRMVSIPVHNFAKAELNAFINVLKVKGFDVLLTAVNGLAALIVSL